MKRAKKRCRPRISLCLDMNTEFFKLCLICSHAIIKSVFMCKSSVYFSAPPLSLLWRRHCAAQTRKCSVKVKKQHNRHGGGDSLEAERQASDQKFAESRFDSRFDNVSLCPWERHFTLIAHWGQAIYPLWWSNLTKDL